MADIYLLIEGQQQGPYTAEQLRQSLAEGLVLADLPAWHEGLTEWVHLTDIVPPSPPPLPIKKAPPPLPTKTLDVQPAWERGKLLEGAWVIIQGLGKALIGVALILGTIFIWLFKFTLKLLGSMNGRSVGVAGGLIVFVLLISWFTVKGGSFGVSRITPVVPANELDQVVFQTPINVDNRGTAPAEAPKSLREVEQPKPTAESATNSPVADETPKIVSIPSTLPTPPDSSFNPPPSLEIQSLSLNSFSDVPHPSKTWDERVKDSSCARLGDKEDEIMERYGDNKPQVIPQKEPTIGMEPMGCGLGGNIKQEDKLRFSYSGFNVAVVFLNGIAEEASLSKISGPILPEEATILLNANSQGHVWKKVDDGKQYASAYEGEWLRDDQAQAFVINSNFHVKTKLMMDAREAAEAAYKARDSTDLQDSALARLGETEDQLINRYGKPDEEKQAPASLMGVDMLHLHFLKGDISIYIYLLNGVSVIEEIGRQGNRGMSEQDYQILLADNSEGHVWKEYSGYLGKMWIRDDGAQAIPSFSELKLTSKAYFDAKEAAKQVAQHPNMQGF